VPSADEVVCDGIDMAIMDATLLKKIEELTLYVLDLKAENNSIKEQLKGIHK
jgi:trimeric autotransporter adhesin